MTTVRSDFGPSGLLLPDGPQWPVEPLAPDIKTLPQYVRKQGDEWTTVRERRMILAWVARFFAEHKWASKWSIQERFMTEQTTLKPTRPWLVFSVYAERERRIECVVDFAREDVDSTDAFQARLAFLKASIEALHDHRV